MVGKGPRNRRWFSFSLRAFLAGVLIVSVFMGVGGHRWNRYQQQKSDMESWDVDYHRTPSPWRYVLSSVQLTDDVRGINSIDSSNEIDLDSLRMFRRLEYLSLFGHSAPDITPLAGLTQLQVLDLTGTEVADLTPLKELLQLQELWLGATSVTDLIPLAGHTQLKRLYLQYTGVTDLRPLADLTQLQVLSLYGTRVADLTPLAKLADVTIWVDDYDHVTIPVELVERVCSGNSK